MIRLPGGGRVRAERGQAGQRIEVLLRGINRVERQGRFGEPDVRERRARTRGCCHVLLLSGAPRRGRDTSGVVPRAKAASMLTPGESPNAYTVRGAGRAAAV